VATTKLKVMQACRTLALASAVWLTAAAAMAQAPPPSSPPPAAPPAQAQAQAPATAVSPLTVEGTTRAVLKKQTEDFVESYAQPTRKLGLLARWNTPACVVVNGLAAQQAVQFKTQIEAVAKAVKAPVGRPGCAPNIEIVFTNEPQRYVAAVATRNPAVLGYGGDMNVTRPIQAWYATGDAGVPAQAPGPMGDPAPRNRFDMTGITAVDRFKLTQGAAAARRCVDSGVAAHNPRMASSGFSSMPQANQTPVMEGDIPCPHSLFLNVLIVVDVAHMGDVSVDTTSDYLALVALSQPKPRSLDGCLALPSVLDLYAKECPGRDLPTGLTAADRAYLAGLYTAQLEQVQFGQSGQSQIAGSMIKALAGGK
jgi:hypothetical protein